MQVKYFNGFAKAMYLSITKLHKFFREAQLNSSLYFFFFIKNCHISLLESNVILLADMMGITPAPTERSATASGFSSFLRSFRLVKIRKMVNLLHAIVNGQKPAKNQNNVSI